eukprot:SAG31_NODE_14461_length_805_cov_0.626062_1_plen_30_part_01
MIGYDADGGVADFDHIMSAGTKFSTCTYVR